MFGSLRWIPHLPRGFLLLAALFAASLFGIWWVLAGPLGLVLGFVAAWVIHQLSLFVALQLASFVPRLRNTPSYALHERLGAYRGSCPPFEDRAQHPAWVADVERAFPTMKQELAQAREDWTEDPNRSLMSGPFVWNHLQLCDVCPKTYELFKSIPGFRDGATFSKLAPHARIKAHSGDSDIYYRCHLGFRIPGPLPMAGFEVDGQRRSWEEGKLFLFCDSYRHSAWNDYDEERIILLFDVLRPQFVQHEQIFSAAYNDLIYLKTGISSLREPAYLRPLFIWMTAVMVIYDNVFRHTVGSAAEQPQVTVTKK